MFNYFPCRVEEGRPVCNVSISGQVTCEKHGGEREGRERL